MPTLDEVRKAKASAEAELMKRPGVTGVSVARKYVAGRKTDELAIRVIVAKKRDVSPDEQIPKVINGVKTDVVERIFVPRPRRDTPAGLAPIADTKRHNPLLGGISIGPCRAIGGQTITGTLGALVKDVATGDAMVLSNFHVLAVDTGFSVGDPMAQPSLGDSGSCRADVVATLERAVIGNQVDCAVAKITARDAVCRIADIGAVNGTGTAKIDMPVRKRGRTTGVTSGIVDSIDLTTTVDYPGLGSIVFTNQVEILAEEPGLAVEPGFFIATPWSTAAKTTAGDVRVERRTTGPSIGVTVATPKGSRFHQTLLGKVTRYMVFGSSPRVLILDSTTAAGPVVHTVTAVDVGAAPPAETLVITGTAANASVPLPVVQRSQGDSAVFLIHHSTGTQIANLSIRRSQDGEVLCAGPPPFVPTGETRGEATELDLVIHSSSGGTSKQTVCPLVPGGTGNVFGLAGDSGAVVVDSARRVIGLFFASNEAVLSQDGGLLVAEGAVGVANPIQAVLNALGIELCRGGVVVPPDDGNPVRDLSMLVIAAKCLGRVPPISVRKNVLGGETSLRERLKAIVREC